MTFADSGISSLSVAGPAGLLHFMAAMRKYTFRYIFLIYAEGLL